MNQPLFSISEIINIIDYRLVCVVLLYDSTILQWPARIKYQSVRSLKLLGHVISNILVYYKIKMSKFSFLNMVEYSL